MRATHLLVLTAACTTTGLLAFLAGRQTAGVGVPAALVAHSSHEDPKPEAAGESDEPGEPGELPEAARKQLEAWMAANAPGTEHRLLEEIFAGEWKTKLTAQTDPEQPETVMEGEASCETIMDGRFVVQRYRGEMMGLPMEGMGITGYNNATGKFQSVWLDSNGTAIAFSEGPKTGDGTLVLYGTETDATSGQTSKVRDVAAPLETGPGYRYTRYYTGPDGEEIKGFTIEYTPKG